MITWHPLIIQLCIVRHLTVATNTLIKFYSVKYLSGFIQDLKSNMCQVTLCTRSHPKLSLSSQTLTVKWRGGAR